MREDVGDQRGGLNTYVAGDLGFNTDAEEIFADLDAKLLIATVLLVLVLLGAIYRAVLVAITPLIVVFFAYNISTGFIYLLSQAGSDISTSATSILIVLMFGVGTDYCLLLVSRYREELHRHEDKHDAIRVALERTGPAIIASGLTVALSMLVLLVAITGQIEALGPVSAIGITFAFIAGVTLFPALLAIFGRVGFWPRRGAVAYDPAHAETIKHGVWGRFGAKVLTRPGRRWPRRFCCSAPARSGSWPTRRRSPARDSSRNRWRAWTASRCSSARCPPAPCRPPPCWFSARTAGGSPLPT